ncbi:MAG: hypothetical protein Q8K24_05965 [Hydrogenophaga sp.]|nr:hypothetical protein [Hydrogenophaga sp.]
MSQVTWFESSEVGAPTLSNAQGSLLEVLRACLVNGFGGKAITSIAVAAGVATVTSAAHGFTGKAGQVVLVAGAPQPLLNGVKQPGNVLTNSFTYAAPGVPDGTYTGTISVKRAPAGWTEAFTAVDRAVFRSGEPEATGISLRVLDAAGLNARVRAFESMTDIDTGVGMTPTEAQVSGGFWWSKTSTDTTAVRPWAVFADGRAFYFCVMPAAQPHYTCFFAGDVVSRKPGDAYGFMLTGNHNDQTSASGIPNGCAGASHKSLTSAVGGYVVRVASAAGASTPALRVGAGQNGDAAWVYAGTAGYGFGTHPNASDGALVVGRVLCIEANSYRGELPGLYHPVQVSNTLVHGTIFPGLVVGATGRRLCVVAAGVPANNLTRGTILFDVTGSWRTAQ